MQRKVTKHRKQGIQQYHEIATEEKPEPAQPQQPAEQAQQAPSQAPVPQMPPGLTGANLAMGGEENMDTAARVLALAQQTADQAISDARREADETLGRARQESEDIQIGRASCRHT